MNDEDRNPIKAEKMKLKTFLSRDEAGDFAKAKRAEGMKTTLRTFNNGTKDAPAIRFMVRWS